VERRDEYIEIRANGKCCPFSKNIGWDTDIRYHIYPDGHIVINTVAAPYGRMPEIIPRVGVVFALDKKYDSIEWYGRGKHQSYSDCKLSAPVGLYESNIAELNFMFDYPQETGNRENTRFVRVNDGTSGITVASDRDFSFSYHNFTLKNLTDAFHCNEIEESEKNYLYIDYKNRPLGSNSCGPNPEPEFELYAHKLRFVFSLSPDMGTDAALNSAKTDFGEHTEVLSERYIPTETISKALLYADCDIN
jgi:beta-galactosidase/evolved beta-galactosidase subunit alpha